VKPIAAEKHRHTADNVIAFLSERIREDLRHGFFKYSITCEIVNFENRRVVVDAGTSHRFFISKEDLGL